MESEWPYKLTPTGVEGPGIGHNDWGIEACFSLNTAYAEGRKSMEKEIEEKKAIKDTLGVVILNVAENHTLDISYGWKAEEDGTAGLMETAHSRALRFLCAALSGGTLNNKGDQK